MTYVNLAENASAKAPAWVVSGRLLDVNLIKLARQGWSSEGGKGYSTH